MKAPLVNRWGWQPSVSDTPKRVAYILQEPLKEELERLKRQQIIVPLYMDETSEWCYSFVLVPKANGKVRLCVDPARLNKTLVKLVHKA